MSNQTQLTFMTLLDWLEGRLSEDEAARVATKFAASDAETQGELAWLRALLSVGGEVTMEAQPERIRQELLRRFRAQDPVRVQPAMMLVANLSSDSFAHIRRPGLRGASGGPRQLVYSSAAADVVINLRPRNDGVVDLVGQIFPLELRHKPAEFVFRLLKNGRDAGITEANELGEFAFNGLKADRYDMVVSHAEVEIQLNLVDLRRP